MRILKILGVDFRLTQIEDKLLLQVLEPNKNKIMKVPILGQAILNKSISKLENIVASESELLLYCQVEHQEKIINLLEKLEVPKKGNKMKLIKIDVCFELALDWEKVCAYIGLNKEKIIDRILKEEFPLINYGFQPGFMYLDHLPKDLQVPRLNEPRQSVLAGSLAIGGKYIGIYGSASPGGWNIIGLSSHKYGNKIDQQIQIGQVIKFNRLSKDKYLRKHQHE